MAYNILKTDGSLLTTVADGTISSAYSGIQLPGRNYNGYGAFVDTNFVRLLENFASGTAPTNTLKGQLWFKPGSGTGDDLVKTSRLSVALTDGAPGITSSWANIFITRGSSSDPEIVGNLTVGGWIWGKSNVRFDGQVYANGQGRVPGLPTEWANTANWTYAAQYVANGDFAANGNVVGREFYGNFTGKFSGDLVTDGYDNGVIYKQNSVDGAVAAEYMRYNEIAQNGSVAGWGNLKVVGNTTFEASQDGAIHYAKFALNSTDTVASPYKFSTSNIDVTFGNAGNFSTDAATMKFANGTFDITTRGNTVIIDSGSSFTMVRGSNTQASVDTGTFRVGNDTSHTTSIGSQGVISRYNGYFHQHVGVGTDVVTPAAYTGTGNNTRNTSLTNLINNDAMLTVYGSHSPIQKYGTDTNWPYGNSALNVRGGMSANGNINIGNGVDTDGFVVFWGTQTGNYTTNTQLNSFDSQRGVLQSMGGISANGHIWSHRAVSGANLMARAGDVVLDNSGNVSIVRQGSGTAANVTFYFNSGATSPAVLNGLQTPNAAYFRYGITTANIVAGWSGTSPDNTAAGRITGRWVLDGTLQATYADLAERFEADEVYAAGTVVELGGIKEITAVKEDASERVFGVVSDSAAYIMNGAAGDSLTHPPIALVGRVKVRAVGTIKKGDRLISAGQGRARAARRGEATHFNSIGRALEDKTTDAESRVLAAVEAKLS